MLRALAIDAPILDVADELYNELCEGNRRRMQAQQEFNRMKAFEVDCSVEIPAESDVVALCSKIKRRQHADADDLVKLGQAFLQNENNIAAFVEITGSIDAIVKELAGTVRRQQILAAQCLCNMSLGNELSCAKIAASAGIYLLTYLESIDVQLGRICFWAVLNIAASGDKALTILMAQELLAHCLELLKKPSVQDEAVKLLDIIIDSKWDSFSDDEKLKVQAAIKPHLEVPFSDPLLLQIFLKTLPEKLSSEPEENMQHIIEILVQELKVSSFDCELTYFIARTLVQLCHNQTELMSLFAYFSLLFELSLANLVKQAIVEPKLVPALNELMHLASLFYAPQHQEATAVVTYCWSDLLPENFTIPKLFDF